MSKIVAIVLVFGVVVGCATSTEPIRVEEFSILVDSIAAPDTVQSNKAFLVEVWAKVGPNLCYQFSRFELKRSGKLFDIEVVGERTIGPVACPYQPSEIRGLGFAVNPPYPSGGFTLVFEARGGGAVEHSIVRMP